MSRLCFRLDMWSNDNHHVCVLADFMRRDARLFIAKRRVPECYANTHVGVAFPGTVRVRFDGLTHCTRAHAPTIVQSKVPLQGNLQRLFNEHRRRVIGLDCVCMPRACCVCLVIMLWSHHYALCCIHTYDIQCNTYLLMCIHFGQWPAV